MNKLEKLIKELCPIGVEYIKIDDVFLQFPGMTGVSKKWKESGNCKFIDYMNVYKNLKVDVNRLENATVKNIKQNKLCKGDILLTSASEIPEECAISSVIEDDIEDGIFLDDHLFALRLKNEYKNIINPIFINYYMHSFKFRKFLNKCTRGVTRFYISMKDFMKMYLPVPPIEVQNEIVQILDSFTELEAELEAELEVRLSQYDYYRDALLNDFENYMKLDSIVNNVFSGKNKIRGNNLKYPVYGSTGIISSTNDFVYDKEQILVARVGANAGFVHLASGKYDVSDNTIIIDVKENYNLKFLYYFLQNYGINKLARGGGQPLITSTQIKNIKIPNISIIEQKKIVSILDRFDKLCNDITQGLPAEIEARKKQYEYYRDKLLDFKELKVEK